MCVCVKEERGEKAEGDTKHAEASIGFIQHSLAYFLYP
jgi:hypothetical protein